MLKVRPDLKIKAAAYAAYRRIYHLLGGIVGYSEQIRFKLDTEGGLNNDWFGIRVLDLGNRLDEIEALIASVPGSELVAAARDLHGDANYNVGAEWAVTKPLLDALLAETRNVANSSLGHVQRDANNKAVIELVPTAQLGAFSAALDAFLASIE